MSWLGVDLSSEGSGVGPCVVERFGDAGVRQGKLVAAGAAAAGAAAVASHPPVVIH